MPVKKPSPQCPPIDPKLIEFLSHKYPDQCPDPEDSPREIWMATGQAVLIRHLKARYKAQTENLQVT